MSNSTPVLVQSDTPAVHPESTDEEQPRKYLRRNYDVSIGVTTRSRQREQDQITKSTDSMAKLPNEQCAICMEDFNDQEVGIPENCEHTFCLPCIIEWAKKNNSCPIDRKAFRHIAMKHSFRSPKSYDKMKVQDNRLQAELEDDFLVMINDDVSCRVCGRDDQENLLLICDECGNGYHTFCLDLPDVPNTPEWMCPLCEVDQLSADEDLYEDSDLEELQHILFDDSVNTNEDDDDPMEPVNATATVVRQPRVRQTARMRTGGLRNQGATSPATRPRRPRRQRRRRRRSPARAAPSMITLQRQRQRRQQRAQRQVTRRIQTANTVTNAASSSSTTATSPRGVVIRNEAPRLSIYSGEAIAFDDEQPAPAAATLAPTRSVIDPSEAARRIAASGIPILARSQTEPSISRTLSMAQTMRALDRVPTRTIRPPPAPALPPRIPINRLPRIQRRVDAPARPPNPPPPPRPAPPVAMPSFIEGLLNSQQRLHTMHNVRLHGPHIEMA